MKIIKNGKKSIPVIIFKCDNCGCIFEAHAEECVKICTYNDSTMCVAECPCCETDCTSNDIRKEEVEYRSYLK